MGGTLKQGHLNSKIVTTHATHMNFQGWQLWKDKICRYQNKTVPLKWGHHNSNFLTNHARHMKFSGWQICNYRQDKTKYGDTKKKGPLKQGCQNSNFNHWRWTAKIVKIGKHEPKIKFDKILGVPQWGSPSNENTKFQTFSLCELDTSKFQNTLANMKER